MFQSNEITLDTFVVAEGSHLARKVFCAPEIFFDDIVTLLPHARAAQRSQSAKSATRIARLAPPIEQPSPHFDKKEKQEKQERQEKAADLGFKRDQQSRKRKRHSAPQNRKSGADTSLDQPVNPLPKEKSRQPSFKPAPPPAESSIRKNVINKRKQTGEEDNELAPPAHQLPKAMSEAQIKPRDDFGWAKNRVNPTAPRSIYHIAEKRPRTHHRSGRSALPHEVKLLILGFAAILAFLIITNMIVNKPSPPRQPRFSEQKAGETEHKRERYPNQVTFDNAKPIVVSPQKQDQKKIKNTQTKKQDSRNNKKEDKETRKASEPAKRIAAKPQRQQNQQNKKSEGRLQARAPIQAGIPRSWPKTMINGSEDLAKNLFKQVSIESVRLLVAPQQCSPCQIPAVLRDGTRILLTSQSITPWANIRKTGSLNIKANGLLTRTAQGTYSLIVKEVTP
jgi:hypothetical protein